MAYGTQGNEYVQSSAGVWLPVPGDASGIPLPPEGPATMFYDDFGGAALDTTNLWTVASGASPGVAFGVLTPGTGLSSYNAIRSQDLMPLGTGYSEMRMAAIIETGPAVGSGRFWGLGIPATTPSATSLAQEGAGFEIDQATGALYAVTYALGVRTIIATFNALSAPTGTGANANAVVPDVRDGNQHRYTVKHRVTGTYWFIDSVTSHVAFIAWPVNRVADLYCLIVRNNAASYGSVVFTSSAVFVGDTARDAVMLADGTVGARRAKIYAGGALAVSLVSGANQASVNIFGQVQTQANLYDGAGNSVSSTNPGTKRGLDVNIVSSASGISAAPTPSGGQFAAATINSSVVWAVGNAGNATLQMTGGSYTSLPVIFEASLDNQTTWNTIDGTATDGSSSPSSLALTGAATRAWNIPVPGYTHIRVRLYAAGTVTTQPTWTLNQGSFLYDPSPLVAPVDGQKSSFSSPLNSTLVAGAVTLSDFWTLENGGTRTVRITRLYFQISLATAGPAGQIQLTKRSAVNTAGTSVTQPIAQYDSADVASGVVSRLYTAAPTGLGATLNIVRSKRFYGVATTLATMPGDVEWTFGNRPAKGLVLRPGQAIGLNPQAAFGTAPTLSGDVEWTEE